MYGLLLTEPLTFEHYGEIWNNVDMRGEVAMLTRNIVIRGETQATCPTVNGNCGNVNVGDVDTFGAHIKVKHINDFLPCLNKNINN